ncbi:MAG: hypothetical protein U9M92_01400 [Patescibacteria group bacterium]|nr:hypothetical protein [Patescibacteria group bacterium]
MRPIKTHHGLQILLGVLIAVFLVNVAYRGASPEQAPVAAADLRELVAQVAAFDNELSLVCEDYCDCLIGAESDES